MNQIKYIKMNLSVRNLKIQIKKIHNQLIVMIIHIIKTSIFGRQKN